MRTGAASVNGSRVVVPLSARGRALGALAADLGARDPARREDALALLEDLGRRAALALDNARLYAERNAVATTLQRSLLPPDLPRIPGAQLAARYLASGDGIEIGGDFYDCFATSGDDWALVIGDVCGKGAEAAAITALARYTLRAAVLHSRRPAQVLAELNEALLRQGLDYRFCTVLYASVTPRPDGCDVVLATGGHPLPLILRADGEVEEAGVPGTLLGIVREPEISEERVALGRGDALVLYTDGVVEASPSDEALAPERLAELLRTLQGARRGRDRRGRRAQGARRPGRAAARRRGGRRAPRGAVWRPGARGSATGVRLLVVTPEPVDADALRTALGEEVEGAEVLVVSPAGNRSKVAFWVSDSDDAIAEADAAQEETVERLEEDGVDAAGDTGESEPGVAIQDALATFKADRIVVFSHAEGDRDYREDDGLADAEERFGIPVTHALIGR